MAQGKTWQSKMQMMGTDNVAPPTIEDMKKMAGGKRMEPASAKNLSKGKAARKGARGRRG